MRCAAVFRNHTLDNVLTIDTPAGLSFVLGFLVFVDLYEVLRDDVIELAWVKRSPPLGRILMLELECLVEHFPYAWRTDRAAFNADAGIVVEVLAAYLTAP